MSASADTFDQWWEIHADRIGNMIKTPEMVQATKQWLEKAWDDGWNAGHEYED